MSRTLTGAWTRVALSALFLALAVTLFIDGLSLGPTARLVPVAVAVPAIVLLALQLCFDLFPGLSASVDRYLHLRLQGVERLKARSGLSTSRNKQALTTVLIWFAAAPILIYFFGFLLATPLYTIAFLRLYTREGWIKSLAIGASISAVIALLLGFAVHEPLADGWLIERIVDRP